MLGNLAKWLRLMGFDTFYNSKFNSVENFLLAKRKNRLFLTKNSKYEKHAEILFLKSMTIKDQIQEINNKISILNYINPFSRCSKCNAKLQNISKNFVKDKIPVYIYHKFNEFKICPQCKTIYWCGSHLKKIEKILEQLYEK